MRQFTAVGLPAEENSRVCYIRTMPCTWLNMVRNKWCHGNQLLTFVLRTFKTANTQRRQIFILGDPTGHYDDEARLLDKEQELEDLKEKEAEVTRVEIKENKGHNNKQVTRRGKCRLFNLSFFASKNMNKAPK